ncbi:hypothetical protein L3X38_037379 [Prunus dulcis]|uniref:Endonuclease/exonuclease/phosphatase domain-containing protein n=1 Tax=Prunus dulcis TaxID=3755 RepID=A0AAD4V5D0_PRUDU|nr:hypothetical protein L3X38_037379 [Prunus dulcis]
MLVFSWNIRGLDIRRTFRYLKNFLQDKMPDLIFLAETRMTAVHMGRFFTKLGSGGVVCVPHDGLSGGLCTLWKQGLSVQLISSSVGHIDVWVTYPTSQVIRVTGFYSHPKPGQRRHSWELLRRLSYITTAPWLCCGDLNEVLSFDEKSGNRPRSESPD